MTSSTSVQEQQQVSEEEVMTALPEEQARRAGIYSLLAALLRNAPDQAILDHLSAIAEDLEPGDNELLLSLSMLSLASRTCDRQSVATEYHDLFIGIGRGELVPYGSWYQTGFLMELPLSQLRDDLARLGYERQSDIREPEDHIAALFEVMEMLILEGKSLDQQADFFKAHLEPWVERFLNDLANANKAVFYRSVARFAQAVWQLESRYLALLA